MDSPAEQQETLQENLETSVADVYDELEAKDEADAETIEEESVEEEVTADSESEDTVAETIDEVHPELKFKGTMISPSIIFLSSNI